MKKTGLRAIAGRTLKVRDGEWRLLLTMAAIFFLLFTCLIYGRSIRSSLFLTTFGVDRLPEMYLATYLTLAVVATVYTALVDRFDKRRMLALTSLFFSATFFVSPLFVSLPSFVVFIFIIVEVNAILTIIQFWTLCDDSYTGREGKRLFPLIMLFGLATAAAAALGMKPVVALIGAPNIFLLLGLLMFINFLVVSGLAPVSAPAPYGSVRRGADRAAGENPFKRYMAELRQGFAYIASSRFMLAYTMMTLAVYLVNGVVEFQFASAASGAIDDLGELTGYFGLVQGGATFIAFLTNLFFTSLVIEALGIQLVVLLYPAAIAAALAAMTWKFGLFTGTAAKVTNDIFLYSIHDTVSSVLLNPVPERYRSKARIFIQGMVRPAAAVVSSVFLIFAVRGMTTEAICLTALVVVAVWFAASRALGRNYIDVLVENLRDGEVDLKKHSMETLSRLHMKGVVETLEGMTRGGDHKERLFAAKLLFDMATPEAYSVVARLDGDDVAELRAVAVKAMAKGEAVVSDADLYGAGLYGNRVGELLRDDPSPIVRAEAASAYASIYKERVGYKDRVGEFLALFEAEEDPLVKLSLIKALARASRGTDGGPVDELIKRLSASHDPAHKLFAAAAIGELRLKVYAPYLTLLLRDGDARVVSAAIDAIATVKAEAAIPELIGYLSDDLHSLSAYECLVSYGTVLTGFLEEAAPEISALSPSTLTPLLSVVATVGGEKSKGFLLHFAGERHERVRLGAVKALARINDSIGGTLFTEDEALRLCKKEVEAAQRTMALLGGLRRHRRVAYALFLKDTLSLQRETLLTILRLLSDREAVSALTVALGSKTKRRLDVALEALETLLPANIRRPFMTVFDYRSGGAGPGLSSGDDFGGDDLGGDTIGDAEASLVDSALVDSATGGHALERLTAIHDLGEIRAERFIEIFLKSGTSDDGDVKEAAIHAVSKLPSEVIHRRMEEIQRAVKDKALLKRFGLAT